MKKLTISIIFAAVLVIGAIVYAQSTVTTTDQTAPIISIPKPPEPTVITLGFVGDIMMHGAQIKSGYNAETDSYSFDDYFQYLGNRFREYDYMIGNFETPSDPSRKFGAYPVFNAPPAILDALKSAGFDGLQVANNHMFDAGVSGMRASVAGITERGMTPIGSSTETDPYSPTIVDIQGIKVGFVSATYGFSSGKNPDGVPELVYTLDNDKVTEMIGKARERGADIVVMMPHWGNEYQRTQSAQQSELARLWIDAGTDVIVGTHPHVVQPVETITTESGRTGIAAYSLGNFISNQQDRYTDLGGLFELTITDEPGADTPPTITGHNFQYLYTHKHKLPTGLVRYRTTLLTDAPMLPELNEGQKERITGYLALPSVPVK